MNWPIAKLSHRLAFLWVWLLYLKRFVREHHSPSRKCRSAKISSEIPAAFQCGGWVLGVRTSDECVRVFFVALTSHLWWKGGFTARVPSAEIAGKQNKEVMPEGSVWRKRLKILRWIENFRGIQKAKRNILLRRKQECGNTLSGLRRLPCWSQRQARRTP